MGDDESIGVRARWRMERGHYFGMGRNSMFVYMGAYRESRAGDWSKPEAGIFAGCRFCHLFLLLRW